MAEAEVILKEELGDELKQNVVLRDYCSLGVGGIADYFYVAKDINGLVKAINAAFRADIPYLVLGGGYNVVPSDKGYPGLVVKNESSNIAFSLDNSQVMVDSGVSLGKLINLAASRDLGGLEFLFGIPGTIGGAVYGNAGAFGFEMSDFIKSVVVLIPLAGKIDIVKKDAEWFEFHYRGSRLKENYSERKFKPVILTAKLQLVRRRKDEILAMMQQNLIKKKDSQPLTEKSAGSFFKNAGSTPELSAGYLLDSVGGKKMRVGGAAVSKKHANFLINRKNATATDIRELAEKLKNEVKEKTEYVLEEEIEYMGKW